MLFTEYELWPKDGLDMFEFSEVPEYVYKSAIDAGKKYLHHSWGEMTAAMYTDAHPVSFCELSRSRRLALSCLSLAEHLERKGRFLEDIANGIWAICEESTWILPDSSCKLRDIEQPRFDVSSASTGALLAICIQLFRKELSLTVKKRGAYEIKRRVTEPFLDTPDASTESAAQSFAACIMSEEDEEIRRRVCDKILELTDEFLSDYEKGSSKIKGEENLYNRTAYIFDILEMLYNVTDRKFSVFSDEKIRAAAESICKAHLGSDGFSERSSEEDGARAYLFGKRMDYRNLLDFGAGEYIKIEDKSLPDTTNLFHKLYSVKFAAEIVKYGDNFDTQESGYIDSMDLYVKKTKCFSVAVKGGSNSAGNFIVYLENDPYVVDLERSHNLPAINGFTQFSNTKKAIVEKTENGLMLDLTKTYPRDAGIISWMRSVEAEEKYVIITDDYELSKNEDLRIVMLMKNKPILSGDRILVGGGSIVWEGNMAMRVELVKSKAYDYVYRLIFHIKDTELKGRVRIALKK